MFARFAGGGDLLIVFALLDAQLAVIQFCPLGADTVQDVAVVEDSDQGGVARVEHILQPAVGVDIEVIGGLVDQHDVRIGKQHLRQEEPQFPAGATALIGLLCCSRGVANPSSNSPARDSAV